VASGSGHKGITAEIVVDAATQLTRERGLTGWSFRELAKRLDVAPSAIYHHVGDHAAVIRQVARRLVAEIERPDSALDWQDWFEQVLMAIRAKAADYPGVAHWFMMHGPTIPEAARIVDAGIAVLERAGFGDQSGYAYSLLFNQVVGLVAISQDRRLSNPADGDRTFSAMLPGFTQLAATSPGLEVLTESVLRPMLGGPDAEEAYLRRALHTTMRGLAAEVGLDR
jgi:AcrR family transcriptional regulator